MVFFYWLQYGFGIFKKVLLVTIVFLAVIFLMAHFIGKDRPQATQSTIDPIQQNRQKIYKIINDPQLNKTPQGKISIALYRLTACSMLGEACTNNPADGNKNFNHSVFGFMANLIALPYENPPASGVYWAYNGLQNAGFIPKTYAAEGIGFGAIGAFSKIWVAFRDVAYTVLVLVIIAIGFMIMFRMKLNPQTVISVENALPRIVIALIMITFSFAIVGFLIDLMYMSIALLVSILGPAGGYNVAQYQQKFIQGGITDLMGWFSGSLGFKGLFFDVPNSLLNLIPQVGMALRSAIALIGIFWLYPFFDRNVGNKVTTLMGSLFPPDAGVNAGVKFTFNIGKIVTNLLAVFAAAPFQLFLTGVVSVTVIAPFVVGILLFIGLMFAVMRVTFLIFSAYSKVILNVIIAPLYLLLEAIPGQNAFSSWFKGLIAELIVFPTIVGIILIGEIIIKDISTSNIIQFPFQAGIDPRSFGIIIGLVILYMTPDLVKTVKQMLVPKPGPLDQAGVGVLFGGVKAGVDTGVGEFSKWASTAYYAGPLMKTLGRFGIKTGGNAPPSNTEG